MDLSFLNPFKKPTPQQLAKTELETAERMLLASQSQSAYYLKMAEYYSDTVKRLNKYLNTP